jgi:hypothetical protein
MFVGENRINVPPYVGVPSLSHQFPVTVVVVEVEVGGAVVVVVVVVFVVVVVVVVDVGVDVVVVVVLLQDAKTIDATMRQVSAIQIAPFFIHTSLYIFYRNFTADRLWFSPSNCVYRTLESPGGVVLP